MQIELSEEQQEFVRRAVESGRVRREEDAIKQALDLWVERERNRDEILAAIDVAEAELARGEEIVLTKESMRDLFEDVKHRGRERLAARRRAPG
jgi:Arc/MetJ-type ribon-helix-helix transcriptional regulator